MLVLKLVERARDIPLLFHLAVHKPARPLTIRIRVEHGLLAGGDGLDPSSGAFTCMSQLFLWRVQGELSLCDDALLVPAAKARTSLVAS